MKESNSEWKEISQDECNEIEGGGLFDLLEGFLTNKILWSPVVTSWKVQNMRDF